MNYPDGFKRLDAIDAEIDDTVFKEVILKQLNYMRIEGINLVDDADDLVNQYLQICKALGFLSSSPISFIFLTVSTLNSASICAISSKSST